MQIRVKAQAPPDALVAALSKVRLRYTCPIAVYVYLPYVGGGIDCGVFGDGENGAYEWFTWRFGVLATSDGAYGAPEIALRDVLLWVLGMPSEPPK
ncbi:hypothetical protein SAMN05421819_3534 [Bryocella elongata]|uniref:Uncharacterized protein n=1 Tax=Bryocella elongata TaxID=863522 RepID=A0A1H6B537_9BACT|nr:hypothetical protein [Bryocella elongata]SEG55948.1 hypothetical protein SAMN05421819_3534 [Bryocella elongata]